MIATQAVVNQTRWTESMPACFSQSNIFEHIGRQMKRVALSNHGDILILICMPFVILLLLIAIMPLALPSFWEKNRNKAMVTFVVSRPVLIFTLMESPHELLSTLEEYISFILLLASFAEGVTKAVSHVLPVVRGIEVRTDLLAAISCGAVFMGANTYIGNGPNFMVKAIAEEHGVKVPHFFGYMMYPG
jgi:hypothetical protein